MVVVHIFHSFMLGGICLVEVDVYVTVNGINLFYGYTLRVSDDDGTLDLI